MPVAMALPLALFKMKKANRTNWPTTAVRTSSLSLSTRLTGQSVKAVAEDANAGSPPVVLVHPSIDVGELPFPDHCSAVNRYLAGLASDTDHNRHCSRSGLRCQRKHAKAVVVGYMAY